MIIAIDVYYWENKAKAVSVEFDDWANENVLNIHSVQLENIAEYVPGQFYKRELPCILKVLECSKLDETTCIIVDGYVTLDDAGKFGLGGYLYESLDQQIPIIGVAKRKFHANTLNTRAITRGQSTNPLHVTSIGIDLDEAAQKIQQMKGAYRMPDVLKLVDTHTRIK